MIYVAFVRNFLEDDYEPNDPMSPHYHDPLDPATVEANKICYFFEGNLVTGQTCALSLTNKTLLGLIVAFCGRNVMEIGKPVLMSWWKQRQQQKAMARAAGGTTTTGGAPAVREGAGVAVWGDSVAPRDELSPAAASFDGGDEPTLGGTSTSPTSPNDKPSPAKTGGEGLSLGDVGDRAKTGALLAVQRLQKLKKGQGLGRSLATQIQTQTLMEPYGSPSVAFDGSIEDFSEFIVMFGFVVLFSMTFPLVALLIYAACLMEIFVDDWKVG